jgi:hypothetical protein
MSSRHRGDPRVTSWLLARSDNSLVGFRDESVVAAPDCTFRAGPAEASVPVSTIGVEQPTGPRCEE